MRLASAQRLSTPARRRPARRGVVVSRSATTMSLVVALGGDLEAHLGEHLDVEGVAIATWAAAHAVEAAARRG